MSATLKERHVLRKIKKALNTSLFGHQNKKLGRFLNINPKWLLQSRLNYRYIFNNIAAYWPQWAIQQFHPSEQSAITPYHELLCLNTSQRETLTLENHPNHYVEVNANGYIAFPYLKWGIDIKLAEENGELTPFFNTPLHLTEQQLTYENNQNNLHSTCQIATDNTSNTTRITINIQNNGPKTIKKTLLIGVLPYTNEGVGCIQSIHYLSTQSLLVNDHAFINISKKPSNIICTKYTEGNIFHLHNKWHMILNNSCPDFLCNGLLTSDIELSPNQTFSVSCYISQPNKLITPLFFPFKHIRKKDLQLNTSTIDKTIQNEQTQTTHNQNHQFHITTPTTTKKTLIIQNYTLNHLSKPYHHSLPLLYFNIKTLANLNATHKINTFCNHIFTQQNKKIPFTYLSSHQSWILTCSFMLDTLSIYSTKCTLLPELKTELQQSIKNDAFRYFIQKLSINQFQKLMKSKRSTPIITKLCIFLFICNKAQQHKLHHSNISQLRDACHHFIQTIISNTSIISHYTTQFIQSNQLTFSEKTLLCTHVFPSILPSNITTTLCSNLYQHSLQNPTQSIYKGHSEMHDLLIAHISPKNMTKKIHDHYLSHINTFGNYQYKKSESFTFQNYPQQRPCYHPLYLYKFFQQLIQESNKNLHIHSLIHFEDLSFNQLNTSFGQLSMSQHTLPDTQHINISHEFHTSPESLILHTASQYKYYNFTNEPNSKFNKIQTSQINIPLNCPDVYLKS
jgi:hypothetical protein